MKIYCVANNFCGVSLDKTDQFKIWWCLSDNIGRPIWYPLSDFIFEGRKTKKQENVQLNF